MQVVKLTSAACAGECADQRYGSTLMTLIPLLANSLVSANDEVTSRSQDESANLVQQHEIPPDDGATANSVAAST
eukprot:4504994-Pyramimonas_sp.AAC.1